LLLAETSRRDEMGDFMEWMLMPLRRYADFSGRSRRKEYWMFVLFEIILFTVVGVVAGTLVGFGDLADPNAGVLGGTMLIIFLLLGLALLIPGIAVTVRRFHDQDKSGWFVLLGLIPYLGGLIVLVFMLLEGTRGSNRFGPDPKEAEHGGALA
jgi:uncharacterized membrane protein YhaH (DUF805 family)